jgi:hypothetical protein
VQVGKCKRPILKTMLVVGSISTERLCRLWLPMTHSWNSMGYSVCESRARSMIEPFLVLDGSASSGPLPLLPHLLSPCPLTPSPTSRQSKSYQSPLGNKRETREDKRGAAISQPVQGEVVHTERRQQESKCACSKKATTHKAAALISKRLCQPCQQFTSTAVALFDVVLRKPHSVYPRHPFSSLL